MLTTVGPEFWPRSPEGRMLCLLIAVYAFAVFGYFTAALASFSIGREARHRDGDLAGAEQIAQLSRELAALRRDLRQATRPPSSADTEAGSRASNSAPE
ncbi:hypothetical protein [Piscinibacter sp.]|uniref:hypothetical protein n=1 Tax=Piscinibacter sp. TaxID=1903157 RepID=UPI002BA8C053|nr:hypothetical protein [Albitalea sp.]HUG21709.1 hypothetical protein [Albitalea sp.]